MERHASRPSAPPRAVVPLQELALKLLQPLAGALLGDGASPSTGVPLAALAGLAPPPALSLREALTFAAPGPEEPLPLADHQVHADSTKADRAFAPFASFSRAPADGGAPRHWSSRQRPAGVSKTAVTVTFAAPADVTAVVLELPQDAKTHCAAMGVELLAAPRPRMAAADIAAAVSTASLAATNPAAASMASLMLPAGHALGPAPPPRWAPVGVVPAVRLAGGGPVRVPAPMAGAIGLRLTLKGFGPDNHDRLHALGRCAVLVSTASRLGSLQSAAAGAVCGAAAPAAGGGESGGGGGGGSAAAPSLSLSSSSAAAPQPPPSLAQLQPRSPYRLYTPPADVVRALQAAVLSAPAAASPAGGGCGSAGADASGVVVVAGSGDDDASLAARLGALQSLVLATGGVAPLLEAARLLLAPPVAGRPLPPSTAAVVRPFLRALALQFDAVGSACEGPPPGSWAAVGGDADRTRHACFTDLTGGATIEDGAVGRVVRSRGTAGNAVLNLGILRGRLEWEVRLDKDTHGEECTCFGFARKPLGPGAYDSCPDMWAYRAYNGQVYAAGEEGEVHTRFHPGDVVKFLLDTDRREARVWVNGDAQGALFTGLPADTPLYPIVVFYSTNRAASLLRLAVYDGAFGPAVLVGAPPTAAAAAAGPAGAGGGGDGGIAAAAAAPGSTRRVPVPAPPKPTANAADALSGAARVAAAVSVVPPGCAGHSAYLAQPPTPMASSSTSTVAGSGASTPIPPPSAAAPAAAPAAAGPDGGSSDGAATATAGGGGAVAASAATATALPTHRATTLRGVRVMHGVSATLAAVAVEPFWGGGDAAAAAAGDGPPPVANPPPLSLLLPRLSSADADDDGSGVNSGPRRELVSTVQFADIASFAPPSQGLAGGGTVAAPAAPGDAGGAAPSRSRSRSQHHRHRSRASSSAAAATAAAVTAAVAATATGAPAADPARRDRTFDCFEAIVGFADVPPPSPPLALLQQQQAAGADGGGKATLLPAGVQPLSPKLDGTSSSAGGSPRAGVGSSPRAGGGGATAASRASETVATLRAGCSFTVHLGGDGSSGGVSGGSELLLWRWDAPPVGVPLTRNDLAAAALSARAAAAANADGRSAASSSPVEPHDIALDLLAYRVATAVAAGVPPQHALARLPSPAAGRLELRCCVALSASASSPLSPPGTPLAAASGVDAAGSGSGAASLSSAAARLERVLAALAAPHRLPAALLPVWGDARLRVAPWAGEAGAFLAALAAQTPSAHGAGGGDTASTLLEPLPPHVVPSYPLLAVVAAASVPSHGHHAAPAHLPPTQLVSPAAIVADVVAPAAAPLSGTGAAAALLRVARLFAWEALRALAATGGGASAPEPWLGDPPPVPVAVPWAVQLDGRVLSDLADLVASLAGRLAGAAAAAAAAATPATAAAAVAPLAECLASLLTLARAHVAHLVASRLDPAVVLGLPPLPRSDGESAPAAADAAAAPVVGRLLAALHAATAAAGRSPALPRAVAAAEAEAVMDAGLALFCPSPAAQRRYLARHVVGRGSGSSGGGVVVELCVRWPVAAAAGSPAAAAVAASSDPGSTSARAPLTARGTPGLAATAGGGGASSSSSSPPQLLPPSDGRLERAVLLLQAHAARCGWRHATVGAWGGSLHWLALLPLAAGTEGDDDDVYDGNAASVSPPTAAAPPGVRVDLHAFLTGGLGGVLAAAGVPGWAFPRGCADPPVTFAIVRDGSGGADAGESGAVTALTPQSGDSVGGGIVGGVRVYATRDGHAAVCAGGADGTAAFDAVVARTRAALGVDGPDDAALQQLLGGGGGGAPREAEAPSSALPVPVDVFGDPLWSPSAVAALEEAVRRVRLPLPVESFPVGDAGGGGSTAAPAAGGDAGAPSAAAAAGSGSQPASAASAASLGGGAGNGASTTLGALQAAALALLEELRASEGRHLPSAHAFAALAAAAAAGGGGAAGAGGEAGGSASDERSTATSGSGGDSEDDDEDYGGYENAEEDAPTEDDEEDDEVEDEDEEEYDEDEEEEDEEAEDEGEEEEDVDEEEASDEASSEDDDEDGGEGGLF